MKHRFTALAIALAVGAASLPAPARATNHAIGNAEAAALSDGEIRKVDKDAKKLTIRHGPLENLGMPGMTMVFQVNDAAILEAVKIGDRVKFSADKVGGAYTVTHLEPRSD
jgi:Cu/Ag efflux protein CusF